MCFYGAFDDPPGGRRSGPLPNSLELALSPPSLPRSWFWCVIRTRMQKSVLPKVEGEVAESRRRSAWRGRIARSRQDLPIRSPRMRSNTAETRRTTFSLSCICARLAFVVGYSRGDAKKCVPESRRRSALRGRIARSRQDLPIRSLRS